ncbi:MAG: hypothetical protein AAF992_24835 [Bacteroidota bacterium]
MERTGDNYMFGCKSLYLNSIHPFDFSKRELPEYQELIRLGIKLIKKRGLQDFLNFLMEYQYRIPQWTAMIALEYGNPRSDEILRINGQMTIIDFCLDVALRYNSPDVPIEIQRNFNEWNDRMKTRYNIS